MTLETALAIFILIQNLLLLFIFATPRNLQNVRNKVLGLASLLLIGHMLIELFRADDSSSIWYRLTVALTFVYGPISYYVVMDWQDRRATLRRALTHMIPLVLAFVLYDANSPTIRLFLKNALALSWIIYAVVGLVRLFNRIKAEHPIGWANKYSSALFMLPYGVMVMTGVSTLYVLMAGNMTLPPESGDVWDVSMNGFLNLFNVSSYTLIMFGFACISLSLTVLVMHKPTSFSGYQAQEPQTPPTYREHIDEATREELLALAQTIRGHLDIKDAYCDPDLTIGRLARQLKRSERDVSRAINLHFGKKFPELINQLRVEKACRLLVAKERPRLTVTDVQLQCGFNAKSNFYRVFKEKTGLTPAQFRAGKPVEADPKPS